MMHGKREGKFTIGSVGKANVKVWEGNSKTSTMVPPFPASARAHAARDRKKGSVMEYPRDP